MPANPVDNAAPRLKLRIDTRDDSTVVACRGRLTADVTAMLALTNLLSMFEACGQYLTKIP